MRINCLIHAITNLVVSICLVLKYMEICPPGRASAGVYLIGGPTFPLAHMAECHLLELKQSDHPPKAGVQIEYIHVHHGVVH